MKRLFLLISLFHFFTFSFLQASPVDKVNPFIGTGGHGHVFLGANVPFGRIQVGPSENTRGWDWCSGYHYSDSILIGFGSMHLSGTGIGCLGDIALLPVKDVHQMERKFSHKDEEAKLGYYRLKLHDPEVQVELTATERVAMHRYSLTPSPSPKGEGNKEELLLALDLKQSIGWNSMTDCKWEQVSPTEIRGWRHSTGWADSRETYFVAQFSQPVEVVNRDSTFRPILKVVMNGYSPEGSSRKRSKEVICKISLSSKSYEGAEKNMKMELPGWDFDATRKQAVEKWAKVFDRIKVKMDNAEDETIFYTAMYHLMIAPAIVSDYGETPEYSTFSLWDTYRAEHPLFTVLFPEMQQDFANEFMDIYKKQGKLPIWYLMGCDNECMVGSPGVIVMGDLVMKGFVKDEEAAFQAMKASMMRDDRCLATLKEYGYLPFDKSPETETVAKALEYCIADAAVAKVAKKLGHEEDYKYFYNRSQSYKKYFDPKTRFMRAIDTNGNFHEPFDPIKSAHRVDDYTEGNAWQYTWLVPEDVEGLVNLFGGKEKFMEKLDSLFIVEGDLGADASPDISGLIGQYAHGNEPSHHVIYMYDMIGEHQKAKKWFDKVFNEMYTTELDGLAGNEDVGQMSAWYILSALGLYQVDPTGGQFVIGSPRVREAEIKVSGQGDKVFKIIHKDKKNGTARKVFLNGTEYTKYYIDYPTIMKGGELVIEE